MIVGGSADQARRVLPPGSRALPALARISTSVARANELTQQLYYKSLTGPYLTNMTV